jgi:hypothetical protein
MTQGATTLLDELMPRWDRRIIRTQDVRASTERTYAAIREVDFFESPVLAVPNRFRVAMDRMIGPRDLDAAPQPKTFRFAQLLDEDGGFQLLAEEEGHELVLGFVGRWWERDYGRVEWTVDEFPRFTRPGCAKGTWGFTVLPYGVDTCILVTEVRVCGTDGEARRKFERYWAFVGRFVTAMGQPVLRLIRDQAERTRSTPRT